MGVHESESSHSEPNAMLKDSRSITVLSDKQVMSAEMYGGSTITVGLRDMRVSVVKISMDPLEMTDRVSKIALSRVHVTPSPV